MTSNDVEQLTHEIHRLELLEHDMNAVIHNRALTPEARVETAKRMLAAAGFDGSSGHDGDDVLRNFKPAAQELLVNKRLVRQLAAELGLSRAEVRSAARKLAESSHARKGLLNELDGPSPLLGL